MLIPQPVSYDVVGIPDLTNFLAENGVDVLRISRIKKRKHPITLFNLSSYRRAKEAIDFALHMRHQGVHVYVIGDENSGRMTSVIGYLNKYLKKLPAFYDTVYVNNFSKPHRPCPFFLPAGQAVLLRTALDQLVKDANILIHKVLSQSTYLKKVDKITGDLQAQISQQLEEAQTRAHQFGFEIIYDNETYTIQNLNSEDQEPSVEQMVELNQIKAQLTQLSIHIDLASQRIYQEVSKIKRKVVKKAIAPLFKPFKKQFFSYLGEWITDLYDDFLNHIDLFIEENSSDSLAISQKIALRYNVNIMINHSDINHPEVILEPRPTYENLFGSIKYRSTESGYETDFSLIRPGALHAANGGFLVLRAEDLANDFEAWEALKKALRDRRILIQERHRDHSLPMIDAPSPKSVDLDVQVFIIGSPYWYQNFFYQDNEFFSYFKIKADIEPDMPVTVENAKNFLKLIFQVCRNDLKINITCDAVIYLLGYATVWAARRDCLTSHFESVLDFMKEAKAICHMRKTKKITIDIFEQVIKQRHVRNRRIEDRLFEDIKREHLIIDLEGSRVGQVNALTVMSFSDSHFGLPSRVTARTYASKKGLINIERKIDMAGPIQQKGAFIIESFLNGIFAQKFPLSFGGAITFEQNYVDIDGDSASMAECVALLSSLSELPVRQDVAITGSIDQFGRAQVIGGVNEKIEGFFRVCQQNGLTGKQGVIIPKANSQNLLLPDDISIAIKEKKFFIWGVSHIGEAIAILIGDEKAFDDDGLPNFSGSKLMTQSFDKVKKLHQSG